MQSRFCSIGIMVYPNSLFLRVMRFHYALTLERVDISPLDS